MTEMIEIGKLLLQAEKAEQAGAWQEARELYEEALTIQPDHQGAQLGLSRLESKEAERVLQRAETLVEAGDFNDAVELLQRIHELQPDNQKIASRYAAVKRRERLEEELQQAQGDALAKQGTGSLDDARDALRGGLDILLAEEGILPAEARHILQQLVWLGDQKEGTALGQDQHWEKAKELRVELIQQQAGQQRWAVRYAGNLAGQWMNLNRDIVLKGLIQGNIQLGNWAEAYRVAVEYMHRHPTDVEAIEDLAEIQEELLNSLNKRATRRIDRARKAFERGDYQLAWDDLKSIEEQIYGPIEQEFSHLLNHEHIVEEIRAEAKKLYVEVERVKTLYEFAKLEGINNESPLPDILAIEKASTHALRVLTHSLVKVAAEVGALRQRVDALEEQLKKNDLNKNY